MYAPARAADAPIIKSEMGSDTIFRCFCQDLATGTRFGGHLPQGAPGPDVAPGIDMPHPNFT